MNTVTCIFNQHLTIFLLIYQDLSQVIGSKYCWGIGFSGHIFLPLGESSSAQFFEENKTQKSNYRASKQQDGTTVGKLLPKVSVGKTRDERYIVVTLRQFCSHTLRATNAFVGSCSTLFMASPSNENAFRRKAVWNNWGDHNSNSKVLFNKSEKQNTQKYSLQMGETLQQK